MSERRIFSLPRVRFRRGDVNDENYENLEEDVVCQAGARQTYSSGDHVSSVFSSMGTGSPQDDTFTVDQAVDAFGFGWFQVKLSLFTGLIWMADAMEMMILSILAPALHCHWNLSGWQQAMMTTVVFCGMMVSSGLWGKICDKFGRKLQLVICCAFTLFYGLLSALSPNYLWILILRALVGFGIGGVPQSVTLYSEFLPSSCRAKCVVMIELFWAVGCCFVVLLSILVMPTLGWRYLLFFSALPLLLFLVLCVWLPESARYDIARGQPESALKTLQGIAKDNNKPMPIGKLRSRSENNVGSRVGRGQLKDLFVRELRWTTVLLWFIWLANAFAYYGIVLMTTELFEHDDRCQENVVENMADNSDVLCWSECKTLTTEDYTYILLTTLAEFPGLFITFVIIEWLGRKKTMAVEFFVFSVAVFMLSFCTSRLVMTILMFTARAFISGAFQAAYVYTPEVYPTTTRAIGLGSCSGMARVGAIVTPFVAQVMLKESAYLAISIYGSICILGTIASLILPIETKGREMKETTADLNCSSEFATSHTPAFKLHSQIY